MRSLELKIPPPAVWVLAGVVMWCVSRWTPSLAFHIPASNWLAGVVAVLGVATSLTAVAAFRRAKTTVNPMTPHKSSSLVTSGINRWTRNPMYLGLTIDLLAWATFLSNAAAFAMIPLFMLYITRFQIIPEERVLAATFGDDYAAYRARVRRWF